MKLYVINPSGEKIYISNQASSRGELQDTLGKDTFFLEKDNYYYHIHDVFAEKEGNVITKSAVGGVIGILGGPIGVGIGLLVGTAVGAMAEDKENKRIEKFNNSLIEDKDIPTVHFLNVLNGDCNIIQHANSGRVTVLDVCNADSDNIYEHVKERELAKQDISDTTTGNYGQKKLPENPINYLKKLDICRVWRFIISHPDMDHIDGIRDVFSDFTVHTVWDTANKKADPDFTSNFARFNQYDWDFYKKLRDEKTDKYTFYKFLAEQNSTEDFCIEDHITVLSPTKKLLKQANGVSDDYNDAGYVLLYTPPIKGTNKKWKILFGGDSHDNTWEYIIENFKDEVQNLDVLIAPHHGRDSKRNYDFVKILNPRITLFGNANSEHLAYDKYSDLKLTNNQAGSVIFTCSDKLSFYVKNEKFRNDYWNKKGWDNPPTKNTKLDAYAIFEIGAK